MSVENAEVANHSSSHEQKMVNGEQHVNGMSNGHHSDKHKSSSHKSSSKDKHRDKDRSKDHKSSKSSHRDKERDNNEKHSSSNGKSHSSSHKSSHKSKDRDKDKEREKHKSSSDKDKDKDKDRERSDKHKSSSSSTKDKHHSSSSGSKHKSKDKDRDREREKDKDRHKSSSSGSKHKSKDKDRSDRDKHKSSSSSHKDKSSSSHHKESVESKPVIKDEPEIKDEIKSPIKEFSINCERLDMSQASSCDYSLSQFKDEECSLPVKSENETESEENNFVDVKGAPDDDDDYENEQGGDESEEDIPLSKRKKAESDSEDEAPLNSRKRAKTEKKEKKKKRVKEESDEDEDDESDYGKSKKKKPKKEAPAKRPAPKSVKKEVESPTKGRKKKKEEEEPEVWKWWEEEKKNDGTKWSFLEHKGPMFAPPYEPLPDNVLLEYNGKKMKLSEDAEEIAGFYARLLDHEYTTKEAFNNNFFKDWRKSMNKKEREVITDLKKCNFRAMQAFFQDQSEKNKNRSKEEKLALKEKNEAIVKEYGIAIIDGHNEKIGNFRIEPPGLFRGRGEHPKMGTLKRRIVPEDIIINCSKDSKVPKPPEGHRWKEVRHDNTVTWLASWTENVQNQVKYIMLNPSSKIKGEKDYMKYETARRLKNKINKIRDTYMSEWKSKEMRVRQRAVALYFIDKLALRAGNEKDEDQADTVGCCSLRYEHVTLHDDLNGKENVVVFDFLGKDSIRYYNEVSVEKRVYKNLQLFKENKKEGDDLFDRLNTAMLNEHLKELMEGLTAKVFRTYNASFTLQNQLEELTEENMSVPEKLLAYNRANRAVAILCNHQRAVPKTHGKSMENLREKIRLKREQIKDVQNELKDIKRGSAKGAIDKEKKKKQLERLKEQLSKLEIQETDKDENKTIALGTSKLNYLDPRISVAWCKKHGVPIEKIFNKTQRDKFRWAIEMADEDYEF